MKRAITIIAAFVVAALLTVAAQATSREEQVFGQSNTSLGGQAACLPEAASNVSVRDGQSQQLGTFP
jgi:hypothetical protein